MEDTLDAVSAKPGLAKKLFYRSLADLRDCFIEIRTGGSTRAFGDPGDPLKAELVVHNQRFFTRAVLGGDIVMAKLHGWDWSSSDVVSVVRAPCNMPKLDAQNRLISFATRFLNYLRHWRNDNTETEPQGHCVALRSGQ